MYFGKADSGITKTLATALAIIVIIGSTIGIYVALQPRAPSPSYSPIPTLTITPSISPSLNPTQISTQPSATLAPTPKTATSPTQSPTLTTTPQSTPNPIISSTPTVSQSPSQSVINVTGFALYKLSETEFVFGGGNQIYNVTMDLNTRAINLNGKLLGGYQIVSALIGVTSLMFTVTGTLNSSTILAQTVLIPTDKDKIT